MQNPQNAQNIIKYIVDTNAKENCDFIALQEATNWQLVQQALPSYMKAITSTSGKEDMVTFYDSRKYEVTKVPRNPWVKVQFRSGRPMQIILFNNNLVFVNVHMPNPIPKIHENLKTLAEKLTQFTTAPPGCRYIVAGDCNGRLDRSLKYQVGPAMLHVGKEILKTCCDPDYTFRGGHVDYVFDTVDRPYYIDQYSKVPDKGASDHKPVLAKLVDDNQG